MAYAFIFLLIFLNQSHYPVEQWVMKLLFSSDGWWVILDYYLHTVIIEINLPSIGMALTTGILEVLIPIVVLALAGGPLALALAIFLFN